MKKIYTEEEAKERHRKQQREYYLKNRDKYYNSLKRYRETQKYRDYYENIGREKTRLRKIRQNAKSVEECDKDIYYKRWTEDEVEFLIDNYQTMTIPQIAKETGRTIMAVERKRNKLGLVKERKYE